MIEANHHPHNVSAASHPKVTAALRGVRRRHDPARHISAESIRRYVEYRLDPSTDRKTQLEQAADLGVSRGTISNLARTPGVFDEIRNQRYRLRGEHLLHVDEATFRQAAKGNVPAARLAYERWDPGFVPRRAEVRVGVDADLAQFEGKSIEELEAMAEEIVADIRKIKAESARLAQAVGAVAPV